MSFVRKKGRGYEEVLECLIDRIQNRPCTNDLFVHVPSGEIAESIGISGQAVRKHLAVILQRGICVRRGRSSYAIRASLDAKDALLPKSDEILNSGGASTTSLSNKVPTYPPANPDCNEGIERNGILESGVEKQLQEKMNIRISFEMEPGTFSKLMKGCLESLICER